MSGYTREIVSIHGQDVSIPAEPVAFSHKLTSPDPLYALKKLKACYLSASRANVCFVTGDVAMYAGLVVIHPGVCSNLGLVCSNQLKTLLYLFGSAPYACRV